MNNVKSGTFPEVSVHTGKALDFLDEYFKELNDGRVYFVAYTIGRITEFGLLSDGIYLNRRSSVCESYEDFFTRVTFNSIGNLRLNIAKDSRGLC